MPSPTTQRANTGNRGAQSAQSAAPGKAGGSRERDETYGLVSVLYHSLQGAETYSAYIADAERADAKELASFFRECQTQENERAQRAKLLLAKQLEEMDDLDYEGDEDDDEDEEDEEDDDEDK